ncbi:androgen-induced gene 1 protein isoform X1 [Mustela nigripes]|uniref:androgen-induced gene 1 protein isoform X1 n=1 Tax=Mustela nigripes TaxID=77151 RepID=UPI00281699B0|nr:androgen-induced gene 1 protein isoform X1 [Mustela nigripes]
MALVPCQVLRVAILLSYCSILCNYKAIEMPSHQTYGGSWKFLTFIDLVIQAVFFGICVLTDLSSLLTRGSGNQEQERQLKKLISLRDWMLAVLAFPVGVFVVAVFWIIYAYDREMIYPKLLDNFIPGWLNHGMHTTVLPFILIEMRTSHHAYPSRSSGLAAICTFSVGYILWDKEYQRRTRFEGEEHDFGCTYMDFEGMLGASCNWDVGVPFSGTHWPRSQNCLLWVYNHLNELFVPAGRSSEQLYLGYTKKASILARHIILPKLCTPDPKCMSDSRKMGRWKKQQRGMQPFESCMKVY